MHVARTHSNRHGVWSLLLLAATLLSFVRSDSPIAIKWCCDQDEGSAKCNLHKKNLRSERFFEKRRLHQCGANKPQSSAWHRIQLHVILLNTVFISIFYVWILHKWINISLVCIFNQYMVLAVVRESGSEQSLQTTVNKGHYNACQTNSQ